MKKIISLFATFLVLSGCSTIENPEQTNSSSKIELEKKITPSVNSENVAAILKYAPENYETALAELDNETIETDKDIYYKRGICYFYLDNYQFALLNLRKDLDNNGDKHQQAIEYLHEQIDFVFSDDDYIITEKMLAEFSQDEKLRDKALIKIHTSNNYFKREDWFGFFKFQDKTLYMIYNTEEETFKYLEKKDFYNYFKKKFHVDYEKSSPIMSINDESSYPE